MEFKKLRDLLAIYRGQVVKLSHTALNLSSTRRALLKEGSWAANSAVCLELVPELGSGRVSAAPTLAEDGVCYKQSWHGKEL